MQTKKLQLKEIKDNRLRKITFKKRRLGIVKKAIQLSLLTGSIVELKIFNKSDNSLIEFYTKNEKDLDGITKNSVNVQEYVKFYSKHDQLITKIDELVTQHGNTVGNTNYPNDLNDEFHQRLCRELDQKNLFTLFSFSKQKTYCLGSDDHPKLSLGKTSGEDSTKLNSVEQKMGKLPVFEQSNFFQKYEPLHDLDH